MGRIYHNPHFAFTDCAGCPADVDVQVYHRDDGRLVAVVSEFPEPAAPQVKNEASLTDAIEHVATRIVTELGYDFDYLIEHYPVRVQSYGPHPGSAVQGVAETFELVTLQWNRPAETFRVVRTPESWPWKHLDRDTAEAIIGEPLDFE